jgi:hypothetical protein
MNTDAKKLYKIVNAVILPNCCKGGNRANTSNPKPEIVVAAAPNNAVPVWVTVLRHASSIYAVVEIGFLKVTFPKVAHDGQVTFKTSPALPVTFTISPQFGHLTLF